MVYSITLKFEQTGVPQTLVVNTVVAVSVSQPSTTELELEPADPKGEAVELMLEVMA